MIYTFCFTDDPVMHGLLSSDQTDHDGRMWINQQQWNAENKIRNRESEQAPALGNVQKDHQLYSCSIITSPKGDVFYFLSPRGSCLLFITVSNLFYLFDQLC